MWKFFHNLFKKTPQEAPPKIGDAELLSPELLAQIQAIQLRVRHQVSEAMAGEYTSAFKGRGMEFEEVRTYQPGDDVRTIDWNVTARSGVPFVKEYREERELTVLLVVDVSGSSRFGTSAKFKHEVAAEVAATLAYTAIHSNDKVGLLTFSDQVENYIPPKKGKNHVWRVIRAILRQNSEERATDLGAALDYLGKVLHRRAVVFLISDFLGTGFDEALRRLAGRHQVVAVNISDPRERTFPNIGFIELLDAESGQTLLLDSGSARVRDQFKKLAAKRSEELRHLLAGMSVDLIDISTDKPYTNQLVRYFRVSGRPGRQAIYIGY